MSIELQMLECSAWFFLAHILGSAGAGAMQRGFKWHAGNRDEAKPLHGIPARLDRALQNFKETFPLFIVAVLLVQLQSKSNGTSALGAQLYLWGRIAYAPFYAFGVGPLRSLAWLVSIVGIVMVLCTAA